MNENMLADSPDIYRKSRLFYIIEAAVEYFLSTFVAGAYLAKMTSAIGIKDSLTGIITAFVSLGFGFQIFALLLAVSSLITIIMIRYCIMEFRCMRVIGKIDEVLMEQAEERYDRIWRSFAPILSINAFLMFLMIVFPAFMAEAVLLPVFGACTGYFVIVTNVKMFLNATQKRTGLSKVLDGVGLYIGIITAYSISAFSCLLMVK